MYNLPLICNGMAKCGLSITTPWLADFITQPNGFEGKQNEDSISICTYIYQHIHTREHQFTHVVFKLHIREKEHWVNRHNQNKKRYTKGWRYTVRDIIVSRLHVCPWYLLTKLNSPHKLRWQRQKKKKC